MTRTLGKLARTGLLALALAVTTAPALARDLAPFKATYAIRWKGMAAGSGELELEKLADGRWAYRSHAQGRGVFRLALSAQTSRSVFRIVDGHVVPDSFTSNEAGQELAFDWTAGRVTGTVNGKPIDLPAQPGLLDPTSVQVALMQELIAGRMPARFVLIDEDRIKDYLYGVEGSENIESVAGTHRADIFSSRRPGSRKATYYWTAPTLGYLPLRVERRNGREVEWSMTLTSLDR